MNAERLNDVATVLEGVPDEKFDMWTWRWDESECGTVACAVGNYAMAYPDRGLSFHRLFGSREIQDEHGRGWAAVSRHFRISEDAAKDLFSAWRYNECGRVTRAEVIARIREFVASDGKAVPHAR